MADNHYLKCLVRAILAGICIGIGGCVLLGCMSVNVELKWIGSILFAVGLMTIFFFGLDLYTGKVGYSFDNKPWTYVLDLIVIIIGNFIGCLFVGLAMPMSEQFLPGFIDGRLAALSSPLTILLKGVFCGMLMFIAADIYKKKQSFLGAFICVPVFILSGFEHSIADMFYFCSAGCFTLESLAFILIVIAGNAIGGILIPVCGKWMYEKQ